MKKLINKAFLLSPIIFFSCASENRIEFCECMDLKKAFTDQYNLSKNEIKEKEKGCLWIENELSPVEITHKTLECWKANGAQYDTISNASSEPIEVENNIANENNIPAMGRANCISEFASIYSNTDNNSATESFYTLNDVILYRYNINDNGFLQIYNKNGDGSTNFVGYGLISDFNSFEEYIFPLPNPGF